MAQATLSIGEVARQVGLKTSAIRFYEKRGVLPEPERRSGQRHYTDDTVRRLRVLDIAKRAGFSLDEAKVLLDSANAGAHEPVRQLAARKLPEVDALIAQAQAVRAWLTTATGCKCDTLDVCGLFDEDAMAQSVASGEPVALSITHACG
jgi:MerR family transcriptional regulator, redox-sensitive transcriptional activator SoxR